jgi:hypothetical protein
MKVLSNLYLFLVVALGCSTPPTEYKVADDYSGPCSVFVYDDQYDNKSRTVIIDSGLARVNTNQIKGTFIFKSLDTDSLIEIVDLDTFNYVEDGKRYIYDVGYTTTHPSDCDSTINSFCFFIGTTSQYNEFVKKYHNDYLEYLEVNKIDWCRYYRGK